MLPKGRHNQQGAGQVSEKLQIENYNDNENDNDKDNDNGVKKLNL